jgi:hypothetical protein
LLAAFLQSQLIAEMTNLGANMYGPNITKTGVHSPPETIYILSKENIVFVLKGKGMAYLIHITIQI